MPVALNSQAAAHTNSSSKLSDLQVQVQVQGHLQGQVQVQVQVQEQVQGTHG